MRGSVETSRTIFIVRGHDEGARKMVYDTLLHLRTDPVVLSEQPDRGSTIVEKLERHADGARLAVILFTPDDVLYEINERTGFLETPGTYTIASIHARLRNNVRFEFGYFVGKLGRGNVIVLRKPHKNWDLPSDVDGILYIPFDAEGRWKRQLAEEVDARGVQIASRHMPS